MFLLLLACRFGQPVVVVVGGGPAGLAAAWEAAESAHVVLLEGQQELGGSALLGDAVTAVPTPEVLARMDAAAGRTNAARTRFALRVRPDVVDWLSGRGLIWKPVDDHLKDGSELMRPDGGGRNLVDVLVRAVEERKVEVRLGAWVERLDRSRGLKVFVKGGEPVEADAVVLATGGFAGNLARVREKLGLGDVPLLRGAGKFADGNGIDLATSLGGVEVEPADVLLYGHGVPAPEDPERAIMVVDAYHGFPVGADGVYLPELQSPRGDSGLALMQHGGKGWIVFDENALRHGDGWDLDVRQFRPLGPVLRKVGQFGPDLGVLAESVGLPRETFLAGLGSTPGNHDPAHALLETRHYGILPLRLTTAKSMTGVRIDLEGRVLDADGQRIAGLYAAGELAGFAHPWEGQHLDSSMVSGAVLTGRAAGRAAREDLAAR